MIPAIHAIERDMINPMRDLPGWCWYSDNPPLCAETSPEGENDTCVRGRDYRGFSDIAGTLTLTIAWFVIIICMVLIVSKVRRLERNMGRYAVGGGGNRRGARRGNEPSYNRTRATSRQALLYISVFFLTYSPVVLLQMIDNSDGLEEERRRKFAVAIFVKILTPLQVRRTCRKNIAFFSTPTPWILTNAAFLALVTDPLLEFENRDS